MKNVFFNAVFGFLSFLVSCKGPSGRISEPIPTSQAEKSIAKELAILKEIESGDFSGLDTIIVDPYLDHNEGNKLVARDSVKKFLQKIHENVPNIKFEILAASATADHLFYLERATGMTIAPSMGWPANTKFDVTAVGFVKVKNGMFVEHQGFYSPRDILKMDSLNKESILKPNKRLQKRNSQ